jgi:hypothetical protein
MTNLLPTFRVGEPLRYDGLCVFPLFAQPAGQVDYRLADEALAGGAATVQEISESGWVPDLVVDNKSDARLLFLEGQELIGAKQNRILNTSVLVAAHSKLKIPVTCVEQGRWRYSTRHFSASGSYAPAKLRRALKASVGRSVKDKRGHRADQGEIWEEVEALHCAMGVESASSAMSDAFVSYQDRIDEYRDALKYVDGACGLAVGVAGRIVSVDFFDKPATCQRIWDRLLSGVVFDALSAPTTDHEATAADVEAMLSAAGDFSWQPVDTVGEGNEYRADSPRGDHASALVADGIVVHGSVMATGD